MSEATEFTDENFEVEVLESKNPVLVDFWGEACPPCRALSPIIDELVRDNADVKIGKVNVGENMGTAGRYAVQNIPTILIFKDGEVVERLMGVQPKSRLQELINAYKSQPN